MTKVALLGVGEPHFAGHLKTLQCLPEIESIVLWGEEPAMAAGAWHREEKVVGVFSDLEELLAQPDIFLAVASIRTDRKPAIYARLLESGIHLMSEKPLARTGAGDSPHGNHGSPVARAHRAPAAGAAEQRPGVQPAGPESHPPCGRERLQVAGPDSTIVPVHPDGTGRSTKRTAGRRPLPRRPGYPAASGGRASAATGCRGPVAGPGRGRAPGVATTGGRRAWPWSWTAPARGTRPGPGRSAWASGWSCRRIPTAASPGTATASSTGGATRWRAASGGRGLPARPCPLRPAGPHVPGLCPVCAHRGGPASSVNSP